MTDIPVFHESELEAIGRFQPYQGQSLLKFQTPITPKENLLRLYRGEQPLWTPFIINEATCILPDVYADKFARNNPIPCTGGADMFGVEWVYESGGAMVRPGNPKVPDIERWEEYIQVPDPDQWDWAGCYERQKEEIQPDTVTMFKMFGNYFERLISLLDFENAAVAMIDEDQKPAVHRLFRAITDLNKKMIRNMKAYFDIQLINFHDDWGSQRAPFFSRATVEEMLLPYMKETAEYMHSLGIYFDFHCCGCVESLVPVMIEAGVDSWEGQDSINDKIALKKQYGDQILFAMAPKVAENATEEEMDQAVDAYMREFASDGRAIVRLGFQSDVLQKKLYIASRKQYASLG